MAERFGVALAGASGTVGRVNQMGRYKMRKMIVTVMVAGTLLGCNTIQGVGEDITDAGRTLERAVK